MHQNADYRCVPAGSHVGRGWGLGMTAVPGAPWAKQRSGRPRTGNPWLRARLVHAAHAAPRKHATSVAAQERRLATRRGQRRAAVAVGHRSLGISSHSLKLGLRTTTSDRGTSMNATAKLESAG